MVRMAAYSLRSALRPDWSSFWSLHLIISSVASSISARRASMVCWTSWADGWSSPSVNTKSPSAIAATDSLASGPKMAIICTRVRLKALSGLSPHRSMWSIAAVKESRRSPTTGDEAPSGKQAFRADWASTTLSRALSPLDCSVSAVFTPNPMFMRTTVLPHKRRSPRVP